jgi:beta-ureidopropionase
LPHILLSMPRIALIQQSASPDRAANLRKGINNAKEAIKNGAEIIVFPELAFTQFFPQHRLKGNRMAFSEPIPGPTTQVFCDLAAKHKVVIVLNLYERDGSKAFDSSPVIDADGSILGTTRMMHITQYESFFEQDYYDPGDSGAPVYDTAHGKLGVCICYDRHYPEYLRSMALNGAQLVVIPQAGAAGEWPEGVFEAELQAGSFQNGFFMALSNRVGKEDVLTFAGESIMTDPKGQVIAKAPGAAEAILYADLDFSEVETSPARTLFLRHRRSSEYADLVAEPSLPLVDKQA